MQRQGVQHRVLIRLVGDVSHGLIDPPARDDGLLGHGAELGIGDELSSEVTAHELVVRLGIVIRSVIRMRPFVDSVGNRFHQLTLANESRRTRPQCT